MEPPDELLSRTVANVIDWGAEEFGVLIDYGNGEWRKYRVGTRDEALRELARIGFYKPGCRHS